MVNDKVWFRTIIVALVGCNVSSPPRSTGGVTHDAGDASGPTTCETGVVIVTSDFMSTNVALSNLDGTTLSGSFVSSGAAKPGLTLALSGDVDVPAVAPASGHVLLIDRFGTDVLTWMDPVTAAVIKQLPVGTGFQSNPHDYIEVDAQHAFVTRYGSNPTPGKQPFDAGGDVLIVDTSNYAITGRIPIPEENPALVPCPDGMIWLGKDVAVTLARTAPDFSQSGDGRIVGVSPTTNSIDWTVDVTGLAVCGRLAVSPSGKLAAIACSSPASSTTQQFDLTRSDIVVYDVTGTAPKELRRLGLAQKLSAAIQTTLTFAAEDTILAMTYGGGATPGDTAFAVNATTGEVTALAQATKAFVFSGMHCSPGCGDVCLLSDAERSKLRRWQVASGGTFTALTDVTVDTVVGLPPRFIGGMR
jgi:hypothetical protein